VSGSGFNPQNTQRIGAVKIFAFPVCVQLTGRLDLAKKISFSDRLIRRTTMPIFLWVAQTKKGKTLKGELEAADEKIALSQLKRRNLTVTKIKPKPKDVFANVAFMQPKVTKKDIVIFTRQFSTMIDAGLPLVQGLNILAEQNENATFKRILKTITKDVEGGSVPPWVRQWESTQNNLMIFL